MLSKVLLVTLREVGDTCQNQLQLQSRALLAEHKIPGKLQIHLSLPTAKSSFPDNLPAPGIAELLLRAALLRLMC